MVLYPKSYQSHNAVFLSLYDSENVIRLQGRGREGPGDKATLTSPMHTFRTNTTVSFKTIMSTADYDVLPKLRVFLKTAVTTVKEPLLVIDKTWR